MPNSAKLRAIAGRSARQRALPKLDPFWVALQWEKYTANKLTYGSRVIEYPARRIKSKYLKTFVRLAKHLDETDLSPAMYFTMLLDRIRNKKRAPIILRVPLLGTTFYNTLVSEERLKRKQQFAGQEDRETLEYRTLPIQESGWTPAALAIDVAKLTRYRMQYFWFDWGRFWLLFGPEFGGAFLYVIPEYRDKVHDPRAPLTKRQLDDWRIVEDDTRLAGQVRETVMNFRSRVRSLPCLQTPHLPTVEQLASQLLKLRSMPPLKR